MNLPKVTDTIAAEGIVWGSRRVRARVDILRGEQAMRETVTEIEKAVLDAMRMGAKINLLLTSDSLENVDKYLESFDGLKADREYIQDRSSFVYPYVGFSKHYDQIDLIVQATVMLEGGEKND